MNTERRRTEPRRVASGDLARTTSRTRARLSRRSVAIAPRLGDAELVTSREWFSRMSPSRGR
jgi:hypothetical protein